MPATMALVKTYWDGAGRQRAVSMWSIGSWGGSGLAAIFGGFLASSFNWRVIFYVSIVVSVIAIALLWGTPESRAEGGAHRRFDVGGLAIFMVTVLALMIVLIFGRQLGWGSALTLGLAAVAVVGGVAFYFYERGRTSPFIDFGLFKNTTFTGATISNFVLNGTIGMLIVSQQMLQIARPELFDPWKAGLLTIGYAVAIPTPCSRSSPTRCSAWDSRSTRRRRRMRPCRTCHLRRPVRARASTRWRPRSVAPSARPCP
jgi:DHA2 family multidrug resistance protein-like MFS transporter